MEFPSKIIEKCLVDPILECLVERVRKHIGYLIHLNSNFENLKVQFQKLGKRRHGVQLLIDAKRRNGQEILPEVNSWVEKVDEISQALQRFIDEDVKANKMCLGGCCPDLKAKKKTLEIDAETRNDQVITSEVERWAQKVDNISKGLQSFIDEDKMCLDLKSRYSLSRKAKKKTLEIDGLLKEAEPFVTEMAYSLPPLGIVSTEVFKHFESRISIMKEVFEAIRDDNINMIAICGMGGIGKTTMAKEVAKKAKDDKLLDEVVMAVVSQNQDLRKIQGQIADLLGLKLKGESELGRANELYSRLMNSKSVLVILDDVWEALNLTDIGIPYGGQHKRCKILLTSRSEEACNQMRSQKIVPIKVLSEEEAWNLFREMAGNCVDTLGLHPIAKEVAKECGALPVAIVTVARALENKAKDEWIAALEQLKKSIPKNIPGLHSKVYSSIEFSYSYLKSDEAKSCFLLCCLFPEDFDIPIEYLVRYGVGLRLFAKIDNVGEARSRVHAMVKDLKRSFLLLDSEEEDGVKILLNGEKEECVKMHDVVRDVAISIAEEHGFLVGCDDKMEEWPEKDTCGHYAAISLFSREIKRHPDGIECPKLELLQLSCSRNSSQTLPANLFQGMKELKVLSMRGMSFPSLPQSIQVLQNLRTLHLEYCRLEDVSAIGALGNLEILSFLGSEIKELPREIGNLGHLKLLDLSKCTTLQRIPYGLLSSLSRLEELYIGDVSVNWEPTGNSEGDNASLAELTPLSHLMALKLTISKLNTKLLPKDLHFKNQMIKFQICASEGRTHSWDFKRTRRYLLNNELTLKELDASDIKESRLLCQLLEKSEILELWNIKDLKSILYELHQEDLPCLKVLEVYGSEDVEYVIDATSDQTPRDAFPILESLRLDNLSNLKEIYHGQFLERSFSFGNLTSLRLDGCDRLKNVFSLSIARGLVQLQELFIRGCDVMEEIFSKEGQDEKAFDMIKFPQLKYVGLGYVPRLIGFCTFVDPIELVQPSHAKGTQPILNQEIGKINTDEMTTSEQDVITEFQHEQHHTGSFPQSGPISNKFLSSKTIFWSPNLGELALWHNNLEVLFDLEGLMVQPQRIDVLAQLKTLTLRELSRLMYVWKNFSRGILGFQNLTSISISSCPNLRYLFPPSIAKLLVELQSVNLGGSNMMENIVRRDGEEEAVDTIVFPKVSSFKLHHLGNLMSFCVEAYSFEWPSMKEIKISDCDKLKTFGSEIQSPRKQKKIKGLDSRPQEPGVGSSSIRSSPGFLGRCLECVPHRRNYGLVDLFDHMCPTKKSHGSSSVNKEGTLTKLKDQIANVIDKPLEILSFFPSNMIECLKNLEVIELKECHSIEGIFQLEELNVEENHVASVLNHLRDLKLNVLPEMMHIWKKGPERIMGFGNLRLLEVQECNSLTYLFSPSIAKLLVMLEEIEVINCQNIEQILARAREEEGEEKDIVLFNKVNSLVLMDLPNLKCFCNEANAFEWPSLKKVGIIRCPNLRTFVPANLKTPELEGVYEDYRYNHNFYKFEFKEFAKWKGDLNATIEHIFKGKEFESRKSMMKGVLEALRDDKINMIAICGMGGIGKTTMAKEIAKRAKDDDLFDEVAMAAVSHNQDLRKIQGQIADMLHLQLRNESLEERKNHLFSRLMDSKSVLVILDDVWEALNLTDIGIPYGGQHKRCKILLTSRSEEACNQMRSQKIVPIKALSEEEAWNLFREMAGNCADTPDLRLTAKKVAKECGGLPVAIVTVGRALANKTKDEWIAALEQLKKSTPKNILGLHPKVYSSIEFSYSYLKSDEAKSCFLLCCLFPEDFNIPIENLVRYGVGRRLFAKIDNVAEARSRVHAMVKDLKRSFLLLDSELEECVKMHYVVRNVAISIADEHGFLVGCDDKMEESPEKDTYWYHEISLVSSQMLPANLFQGMKELKVLSMRGMSFLSLPKSIQVLQNLRTLHLEYCELADVSTIGSLGNLEILSFLGSKIKEFPREIGNLGHLKLLDLSKCFILKRIPYGLLSSLAQLEELYMGGVVVKWEPLEGNGEGNASLAELNSLSHHLMALEIIIPSIKLLPKDFHFKNQMIKFHMYIGEPFWAIDCMRTGGYLIKNSLSLESHDLSDIVESPMLRQLLQKSEILRLRKIKNLKNLKDVEFVIDATSDQNLRAAFPSLERLELSMLSNLEEIYDGQFPKRSFSGAQHACFGNLRYLRLYSCNLLKNVFSMSIAKGLVQLQKLNIQSCNDMEEIFSREGENKKEVDMIKFPKLTHIWLSELRKLIGFCKPMDPVELVQPSHPKSTLPFSNQEVGRISTDELATFEKDKMTDIHHTGSFPESRPISPICFSSKTILWPPNLEQLSICDSDLLEVVFDLEGLKVDIAVLAQLETLTLESLSKLTDVWKNVPQGIQVFQNLTSITVFGCPCLRYLFPLSVAKLLVEVQSIRIEYCEGIENIVKRDGEEEAVDIIVFPKVSSIKLFDLPNLVSFCNQAYSFEWSSLREIVMQGCHKLKIFGSEIRPRKLKKTNEELDSRSQQPGLGSSSGRDSPGFLGQCLECVPHHRNYGPMPNRGTNNKSQGSSTVSKEEPKVDHET